MNLLGLKLTPPNWLQFTTSGRRRSRGNCGKYTLVSKVKVHYFLSRFQVILAATSDLKNKMALAPFLMANVLCQSHQPGSATVAYAQSLLRQPGLPCWCSHSRFIKEQVPPTRCLDGSLAVSAGEYYICFERRPPNTRLHLSKCKNKHLNVYAKILWCEPVQCYITQRDHYIIYM